MNNVNMLKNTVNYLNNAARELKAMLHDSVEDEWVEGIDLPEDTRTHEELVEEFKREEEYFKHKHD